MGCNFSEMNQNRDSVIKLPPSEAIATPVNLYVLIKTNNNRRLTRKPTNVISVV